MYLKLQVTRILKIACNENKGFFLLVEASDDKTYQVKFNAPNQKSNINEFISNYIGNIIHAPVLEGAFLKFSKNQIEKLFEKIMQKDSDIFLPDMRNIKDNLLFGIEWHQNIMTIPTNEELEVLLTKVNNSKEFYSLYAYDQYLKNFDRHLGNHLILKDENKKANHYSLIDGDKIFGSLDWSRILDEKDNFNCLELSETNWHKYLYNLVNEEKYYYVLEFAINVDEIKNNQIELLIKILNLIYTINKSDSDIIEQFLKERKSDFYMICINNVTCFPAIKQSRAI